MSGCLLGGAIAQLLPVEFDDAYRAISFSAPGRAKTRG
jgi:hypothetical protein